MTSGQPSSLPGHFWSREVTWRHFLSCDCHLLQLTALWELKRIQNLTYRPPTATSGRLPVKWRHFRVTSGDVRSPDVISCHVTATSRELLPCGSSNVPKTWFRGPYSHFRVTSSQMTSLPGNFRSREVTWHHFLSRDCHLLRFTALWFLKSTQNDLQAIYSHFRVTSGQLTILPSHFRSRDVISCNVPAISCELQPCGSSNVPKTWLIGLLQPFRRDFRSKDVTSRSLPVTWGNVTTFPVT